MFKKPTKKQFIIRRIVLSTVATFSVLIIATAATLFMLGYRLDGGNGRLEQGALLQFDSTPNGANVYIDGADIGSRTSTKHTVVAGVHTIKMVRYGYEDWERSLSLAAGTLTWLDYIRFVPTNRPVEKVATYESLAGAKISPDRKWALLQETVDAPQFQLIDLRARDIKTTTLVLPASVYTDAETPDITHSFSIATWDMGGRYALVKHLYKDQTEWLVLDTQNSAQTLNVTQKMSVGFKDLQFFSTNGKVLYGLTDDGTIRKVDLSAETLSRAFVTHAESFAVYDNKIISYVGIDPSDATKRVAGVYRDGDEAPHHLRSVDVSDTTLKIAVGRYFSDDFVAIAEGKIVTVLKGSYPSSSAQDNSSLAHYARFELSGPVTTVSFSEDSDYIVAQSGETFTSYEIEHKRLANGVVVVDDAATVSALRWLDPAHLWSSDGGTLTMRNFDGTNIHSIMKVETGFDASLSQNGRFFYGIGKDEKGFYLQRVKMILD